MTGVAQGRAIPGRRLWIYLALTLPLLALGAVGRSLVVVLDGWLLLMLWLEARALLRSVPAVTREHEPRMLLGVPSEVVLRVHNRAGRPLALSLRDDYPAGFSASRQELAVRLPAHGRVRGDYQLLASSRGSFEFGPLHLRLDGALGFGSALLTLPMPAETHVYPNLRGPRRYELAARLGALHSVGVRDVRQRGRGGELEQLREYVPGDPFREVDWKATAKRLRPITRVYGDERAQTVILAIDAGRMMATARGELSKLDHAIHAALLLAWVALRAGDRVGLVLFAERVKGFVPPARGHAQYRRILEALHTVQASSTYVDFRRLSTFVRARVPKRSLLVLFSDLLDESQALPLAAEAPLLRGKHLLVCVTLDDPVAVSLAQLQALTQDDVYRRAAATDVLADRHAVKARLAKAGVGLVEASAAGLSVSTVNRYLEIKTRRSL